MSRYARVYPMLNKGDCFCGDCDGAADACPECPTCGGDGDYLNGLEEPVYCPDCGSKPQKKYMRRWY